MFPKVFLQWCAALSSCAAELERRRQGKFQPLRRLFGKKKRREAERFKGSELKQSHSTDDVWNGVASFNEENNQYLRELNTLGSRAFSHESVFIPEDSEKAYPGQTMSLENVSDKVRNIQRQIGHNIKFGQRPPSLMKSEGDEGSSDEEEVPQSPLRVIAQVESEPQEAEAKEKAVSHDVVQHRTPVKSPRTKRPPPPGTIESINLDAVPQSVPRLDNTAAKHRLSVKPKNQRVSRKHRRFTQDFHKLDLSEMQEEIETQKHEEVFDLPSEDYNIMQRIKEDYEPTEKSIRKRLHEEEQERLELQRSEQERNRKKQFRRIEEQRLEEEQRQKKEEERKQREEEEKRAREEEQRRKEELRLRQEEERNRQEEEEKMRKEEEETRAEERRRQEFEAERFRLEEESKREQEERRRKEAADKLRIQELEEKQKKEEEQRLHEKEIRQQEEEAERKRQEKKREEEERKRQQQEEKAAEKQARATDPEWKRKAEELRWREMEERQRPFTFKVSSGEKQILFQRVNLTPVTSATGQQSETTAETREGAKAPSPGCADSPPLSSSLYVPHTAIFVTGAQLCGTAVNLDQIKDTACKSLLGLSEGKNAIGIPPTKSKTSPEHKSGKTKSLYESSVSADQSNAAVLAEWASIRSKIFKGAEDGKYNENPDESRKQSKSRPVSEDLNTVPLSHTNLRKTLSASAKFSITPARKKFADSNRNSEIFSQVGREGENTETTSIETPSVQKVDLPSVVTKIQNRGNKFVRIADSVEECKFAKDFPSFLVPNLPHETPKSQRSETGSPSYTESEDSDIKYEGDQKDPSCNETPSPFGIKLRRTNYSLRFHNEQSAEKRKKRYSAGDSFEGVPVPLTSDTSTLSEKSSPASPQQETAGHQPPAAPSKESRTKFFRSTLPSACNEGDNTVPKPPLYQKPSTSPKPSEGATPPPSPLPKPGRRTSGDMISQRTGEFEQVAAEQSDETSASGPSQRNGEDELKEKKSFFPSISIPWREKTDRRTELIKREKPYLQIRHSLDSPQTQEKEAGPLWVNLALQKQKGFREQQQNREERKSQREAKLAEKQDRDREIVGMVSPTEDKGNGSSSPLKPQTADENKRPDTLLARFERRENLKKANTLPSSVTVEITDSTPSPPATKDVTKRFPPGDTTQVSTEPAWLALAKRKAKAWSDCPQIIK
ncbi:capping protein inhibiting regulator of actin dynamics isoform X2 [Myxocyprinus asiaticus]|uniref:capping protein inhibiting regulator of actin dynamics isoform X2 n=1 Tax=Myxocyprinus asiaticus TaxID=70543 RepID=UPI00222250D3|nr:capping protein inhibiting regulator of actin dynamics isoform X2 [Myxocyprinus asiaticus]